VAADFIERDEPSDGTGREPWQAPRVTRFSAAGASGGESTTSGDGETSKS